MTSYRFPIQTVVKSFRELYVLSLLLLEKPEYLNDVTLDRNTLISFLKKLIKIDKHDVEKLLRSEINLDEDRSKLLEKIIGKLLDKRKQQGCFKKEKGKQKDPNSYFRSLRKILRQPILGIECFYFATNLEMNAIISSSYVRIAEKYARKPPFSEEVLAFFDGYTEDLSESEKNDATWNKKSKSFGPNAKITVPARATRSPSTKISELTPHTQFLEPPTLGLKSANNEIQSTKVDGSVSNQILSDVLSKLAPSIIFNPNFMDYGTAIFVIEREKQITCTEIDLQDISFLRKLAIAACVDIDKHTG